MSNQTRPSLDALRDRLHSNQQTGDVKPDDPRRQVKVEREGGIRFGETGGNPGQQTQLPQDTYSGWFGGGDKSADRRKIESRIVAKKLPRNTHAVTTAEGTQGWMLHFNCQYGDRYDIFVYFDGAYYQAIVIAPEVERYWKSPHTGHIYSDGRICLSRRYDGGQPALDEAFAKTVVWATGLTAARRFGVPFPFNHNQ